MSMESFCSALFAPVWAIFCIVVGVIWGTISSIFVTLIVLLIALVRFPLHLLQTLLFAATTKDLFQGVQGNLWRLPVLLLTPIGPILYVVAVTAVAATYGTLSLIGNATRIVYSNDYAKAAKNARSNFRFEKESLFGQYWEVCKGVVEKEDFATATVEWLKGTLTLVFALAFACLAFIPFTVAMTAITLYRLPINFFKTMKIAFFTVMLRWDLRIIVIVMLPLIHTIFPVIVLLASLVGSFFWTWGRTHRNLFKDQSPFRKWNQLGDTIKEYYKEHKKFVSKRCDRFDHPSGIPMGWNGQQYGLEIERMVRFQLNFLLCVALALYQTPIILVGTTFILVIKYIPACINMWTVYFDTFISESKCVTILSLWPFHVLAIVLVPFAAVPFAMCFILVALIMASYDIMTLIFQNHASIYVCLSVPWVYIRKCDKWTAEYYVDNEKLRVFSNQCCRTPMIDDNSDYDNNSGRQYGRSSSSHETLNSDVYWDRFASQCVQSTAELLDKGFLDFESVEGMDTSCIQSIPSVAVLTILLDSLYKEGLKGGDVFWKVDGTVCEAQGRAPLDNIATLLWPMVLDLQRFLEKNKKVLMNQKEQHAIAMKALLCDNHDSDESTDAIRKVLDTISEKQGALNNQIRTKINRLVLAILRVHPFQKRMGGIFEYKYDNPNKKMDDAEAQVLDETTRAGKSSIEKEDEGLDEPRKSTWGRIFGSD